ncbi:helix-turn-helix domain-containing protein [Agrobacterium tumefaciens]|uniref:Helix-turn-helix domain-containing protein n=1 Tax=Agrobacterium tumefaciens TaxID=358 RepID=A0AA44JA91_AGRTU|nr:helix-turn-helix domain-containing protein [Agrobacterium tumefaciens]NTC17520.1 helix-turn-helix domain-containing protein [Agrobacterium tumefaciens]NTC29698.1 helix-turn-helix domain-containing protein [Agrobacterium tumefaciens]
MAAGERVAQARELLEETTLSVESIARHRGSGSATNFRNQFRSIVGLPPGGYRSRFHSGAV